MDATHSLPGDESQYFYWSRTLSRGKVIHYYNVFQEDHIYGARHGYTQIPSDILQTCMRENQHLDRNAMCEVNGDTQLFEKPFVFQCTRLTTGTQKFNTYKPLFINAYGRRYHVYIRFKNTESARLFTDKSTLMDMVNCLRADYNISKIVDAKLAIMRPFKYAVCGPKHVVKLYMTGSGKMCCYSIKAALKTDPWLSTHFVPEIYDASATSYGKFMIAKNTTPMSSMNIDNSSSSSFLNKRASDDVYVRNRGDNRVKYFETSVHYKQLQFHNTNRIVKLNRAKVYKRKQETGASTMSYNNEDDLTTESSNPLYEELFQKLCTVINTDTLGSEEVIYTDDVDEIPDEWFTGDSEYTNAEVERLHKTKKINSTDEDCMDLADTENYTEYVNSLASCIVTKNLGQNMAKRKCVGGDRYADSDGEIKIHSSDDPHIHFSWQRDVKHKFIYPMFDGLLDMKDIDMDRFVHDIADECGRSGIVDVHHVDDDVVRRVKLRIFELAYAVRVCAKLFWLTVVETLEDSDVKTTRLQNREELPKVIARNMQCCVVDFETMFEKFKPMTSPCDPVMSVAIVHFNHELDPETNRLTIQQYVVVLVNPPGYRRDCDLEENEVQTVAENVRRHLVVEGDLHGDTPTSSAFIRKFNFDIRPDENFSIVRCETESDALEVTLEHVRRAHLVMGFNSDTFDWPLFENRLLECRNQKKVYVKSVKNSDEEKLNTKFELQLSHRIDTGLRVNYKIRVDEQKKLTKKRRVQQSELDKASSLHTDQDSSEGSLLTFFGPLRKHNNTSSSSASWLYNSESNSSSKKSSVLSKKRKNASGSQNRSTKRMRMNHTFFEEDANICGGEIYSLSSLHSDDDGVDGDCGDGRSDGEDNMDLSKQELLDRLHTASATGKSKVNTSDERRCQPTNIGMMGVFKHIKYISANHTVYVDCMKLVAKNSSKMCKLNTVANRELGIRKLDDPRIEYTNLTDTYIKKDTGVICEYNILDAVLTALLYMKTDMQSFVCCVGTMTQLLPRLVFEDGTLPMVTSVMATNGMWYTNITMPDSTANCSKNDADYMKAPGFKFDTIRDYGNLPYTGGTNGACKAIMSVMCVTADATNMYPREIIRSNVGMTSMLTKEYIIKKKLKRGVDYELAKLTTVCEATNEVVSRVCASAKEDYFVSIESSTCRKMLVTRLHFKSLMAKEQDPFIRMNYDHYQSTCKLGLNKVYGGCASMCREVGAMVTQLGCGATYRLTRMWKEFHGENISNADTDSAFLLLADEKTFSKLSVFNEKMNLNKRCSAKKLTDTCVEYVGFFLEKVNENQEPRKFLFEKIFFGGIVCQGPKNYCGPKAIPTGSRSGMKPYDVSFYVAGLAGGKLDNTPLKRLVQFTNMHLVWLRDVDGSLAFSKVVYDLAFATILVEEVLTAKAKHLCDVYDATTKFDTTKSSVAAKEAMSHMRQFVQDKDNVRQKIISDSSTLTLNPKYVIGEEKVGDMQKCNTVATKAALLHCRLEGLTINHAPSYIPVTRPCHAQVEGVLRSFMETILVDSAEEKKKIREKELKSKRSGKPVKITPASLTRMSESLLAGERYNYKFTEHQYSQAKDLLDYMKRMEKKRNQVMNCSDPINEAVGVLRDITYRREESHGNRPKSERAERLSRRAIQFMEHYSGVKDHYPLPTMDSEYAIGDTKELILSDRVDGDSNMGLNPELKKYGPIRGKHYQCFGVNLDGDQDRCYDLWNIYVSLFQQGDYKSHSSMRKECRWFILVDGQLYTFDKSTASRKFVRKILTNSGRTIEDNRSYVELHPDDTS